MKRLQHRRSGTWSQLPHITLQGIAADNILNFDGNFGSYNAFSKHTKYYVINKWLFNTHQNHVDYDYMLTDEVAVILH